MKYRVSSEHAFTLTEMFDMLSYFHSFSYTEKQQNLLATGVIYGEKMKYYYKDNERWYGKSKNKDNAVSFNCIFLDNDGGLLQPAHICKLFRGHSFAIYNSFTGKNEKGEPKYRVWLPLSRVVDASEYRPLVDGLIQWLHQSTGIDPIQQGGFDNKIKDITQLYYLPCQAKHKEDSFFDTHLGKLWEPEWLLSMKPALETGPAGVPGPARTYQNPSQPQSVDAAIASYQTIPAGQGVRNNGFLSLAFSSRPVGFRQANSRAFSSSRQPMTTDAVKFHRF